MELLLQQIFTGPLDRLPAILRRSQHHFPAWLIAICAGAIITSFIFTPFSLITHVQAAGSCSLGTTLNIVAHEDDDLLFLNPAVLHAIQNGRCVRTIFVTAGDAGNDASYWQSREAGAQAAYAQMSGVANTWTQTDAGISGHPIPVFTLSGKPAISIAFMRLPDGNLDGTGFTSTNYESLQKLWQGTISTVHTVNGSSSYTKATFSSTLTSLMSSFQPDQINTQDYVGTYGDGDHSDHHTVAYFVQATQSLYTTSHAFTGYEDYNTSSLPANVTGTDFTAKQNAFYAYGNDDEFACNSTASCAGTNYAPWLQRQYTVTPPTGGGNQAPTANAGSAQTVLANATVQLDGSGSSASNNNPLTYQWTQTAGTTVALSNATVVQPTFTAPANPTSVTFQLVVNDGLTNSSPATVTITVSSSSNLALFATATASSQNTSTNQTANKAIDGVIDGYPGDYTKEWATAGTGAGSWLKLTWTSPQTVSRIVLYDRPNLNDQITGGTLQFSDGSSVAVGTLNNNGSAVTLSFTAKTVTSVQLIITSVSAPTQNVGLSEIQVYGGTGGTSQPPVANAGSAQTVSVSSTVLLDGSGSSDPNNSPLTYQWTQTAGPTVTLSSSTAVQPKFTAPASPTTLTFQLVVNNGQANSSPVTVTITTNNSPDLALSATATASSQNTSTNQTANKAIDGVIDGYPGDYTKEWATAGTGAGSWLKLTWTTPQTISRIVLYDRPNLNDQITGGTLQFSDGSNVAVGALNNNGSAVTLNFAAKTVTSVQLNITSVSASTQNVGLSEIEVHAG